MAVHAPPGTRAVSPFGVEAFQGTAEEKRVFFIDLEIGAAAEADGVSGDVGDLGGVAVDAVAAEGEGGGVRGGDGGGVDHKRDAGVAARVAEREVVRERVDDAGRDSDVKEANFEARGVREGRKTQIWIGITSFGNGFLVLIHVRIEISPLEKGNF